jgi:hypothetical protein
MKSICFVVASLCLGGADAFSLTPTLGAATRTTAQTALSMTTESNDLPLVATRRSWLSNAGLATSSVLLSAFAGVASAADTKLETFEDANLNFQIKVPANWEKQVQTLPDRRKIVLFIDPTSDKDKVSILTLLVALLAVNGVHRY